MNWETIIRHYHAHNKSNLDRQAEWFLRQPSIENAIEKACFAKNEKNKRHSHQTRIKLVSMKTAYAMLIEHLDEIKKCTTFHHLWELLKQLREINGLGELYIYDTALRIGAYLNLAPEKVYLHAGTRKGANNYGLKTSKREWLEMSELPKGLHMLQPQEVEDILCIYKDKILAISGCA